MTTSRYRKHFAIAALALAAAAGAGAKTLVYCSEGSPENFYPGVNTTGTSFDANEPIYNRLVEFERGGTKVVPGLAEKWEISPDGKVYTFHLRKGVSFHDGTPMNARTVAEDVDRAINPQNPCYVLGRKGVDTYDDFTYRSVKDGSVVKMDVVSHDTLRFTLPKPNAPFLSSVAMVWQGIVSPAATKQYNCDAGQHPVGTGPFKFVEAVRNDHITVDA